MAGLDGLHLDVFGQGDPAIFVHGSWGWGLDQYPEQPTLSDHYQVVIFDRRGFGASPAGEVIGWPTDVEDLANLLDRFGPAHLVGVSSGAVAALVTASRRPGYVRSLVAVEPPLFTLVPDSPAVRAQLENIQPTFDKARAGRLTVPEFVRDITRAVGGTDHDAQQWLDSMSDGDRAAAETTMREAWWPDAPIDFPALANTGFPKTVVNGGYPNGPELSRRTNADICAALAQRINARRHTFPEAGHNPQTEHPQEFNQFLRDFWMRPSQPTADGYN